MILRSSRIFNERAYLHLVEQDPWQHTLLCDGIEHRSRVSCRTTLSPGERRNVMCPHGEPQRPATVGSRATRNLSLKAAFHHSARRAVFPECGSFRVDPRDLEAMSRGGCASMRSQSPSFAAALSRNKSPSRMYRRTILVDWCPVCFMMARSEALAIAAAVAKPLLRL